MLWHICIIADSTVSTFRVLSVQYIMYIDCKSKSIFTAECSMKRSEQFNLTFKGMQTSKIVFTIF